MWSQTQKEAIKALVEKAIAESDFADELRTSVEFNGELLYITANHMGAIVSVSINKLAIDYARTDVITRYMSVIFGKLASVELETGGDS